MLQFDDPADQFFGKFELNSASLTRLIKELLRWNRTDLIAKVKELVDKELQAGNLRADPFPDLGRLKNELKATEGWPGNVARVGSSTWNWENNPTRNPPLGTEWKFHAPGKAAFEKAETGHSFTGIIRIRNPKDKTELTSTDRAISGMTGKAPYKESNVEQMRKIFLFPTQAGQGNSGKYPTRPHAAQRTNLYEVEALPLQPADGGPHSLLVGMIQQKDKYRDLQQDQGGYVGFSVVKGDQVDFPNRYSFTSRSSNQPTFTASTGREGPGGIPESWGRKIQAEVDRLNAPAVNILPTARTDLSPAVTGAGPESEI